MEVLTYVKGKINNGLVRITQKDVVLKIKEISGIITPQEKWNTPTLLKGFRAKDLIPYIRGFWDAEGGASKNTRVNN